jgi:hypothetical protein
LPGDCHSIHLQQVTAWARLRNGDSDRSDAQVGKVPETYMTATGVMLRWAKYLRHAYMTATGLMLMSDRQE